jgi:pimeloyl-ACP methyl ester carboxylesterase
VRVPGPDGEPVAIHDFGGDGPVLLFAHATGMHGWMWREVAASLTDRARCVAPDLRGHGDSPLPGSGDFAWWGFGRDVLTAASAAVGGDGGGGGLVGVGHSMGATALMFAELAAPGTFRELFLYEPAFGSEPDEESRGRVGFMAGIARKRRAAFPSRAEALANFARKAPTSGYQASVLHDYVEHGFADAPGGEVRLKCRPDVEAAVYEHSYTPGAAGRIERELQCPVTLMAGDRTDESHHASVALLARLTGGRAVRLVGATHFGPMERPAALAAEIGRLVLR